MTEDKKIEILAIIYKEWDNYEDKVELGKMLEQAYIWGPLGKAEHYNIDEYASLIAIVELEKNPPVQEEVIV